ncbi:MAG: Crp/Fnr family transcriptional regulator [Bacteroidota bacterium]
MDEFFQYLSELYPLSDELKAALVGRVQKETYRKNRPLLNAGNFCDWIAFIETGLVKVCYDTPGGEEKIISFAKTGEMTCSIKSFTNNQLSKLAIISLDETIIRKIRKIELEAICERFSEFNIHLRKIIASQSGLIEEYSIFQALTAKEKMQMLREEKEWMLKDKRLKAYMISNYLGIDQATFSRLKYGN